MTHGRAKRMLQVLALALAVVAAVLVLFLPSYSVVSSDSAGNETVTVQSIWQYSGPAFALVLAIPVAVALVPVVVRGTAWPVVSVISAVALVAFWAFGAMSVGVAFLPAAAAAVVAAVLRPRPGSAADRDVRPRASGIA